MNIFLLLKYLSRCFSRSLPPLELNCWRFGGPIPFFLFWIIVRKVPVCYPPKTLFLIFGLSITFAVNNYTFFGSLEYIAIGKFSYMCSKLHTVARL